MKKIFFLMVLLSGCTAKLPVPVGDGLYHCDGCAVLIPSDRECIQGGEGWHIGGKAAAC